jgi:hypothetical protein
MKRVSRKKRLVRSILNLFKIDKHELLNNTNMFFEKDIRSIWEMFGQRFGFMVLNTTFNNISIIFWVEENQSTWRKPLTNFIT